ARAAGWHFTARQIFEKQTIAELAAVAMVIHTEQSGEEMLSGEVLLAPIQTAFSRWSLLKPEHFNQALLLNLDAAIDSNVLKEVFLKVIQHHDSLRMTYQLVDGSFRQRYALEVPSGVYTRCDLAALPENEQQEALQRHANDVQGSLNLSTGPLFKAVEYDL